MDAHLEPLASVVRVGGPYGAPYSWAATVRYRSPSEVEIVGAMRAPTPSEWRALRELLRQSGVRIVTFVRHKGDQIVPHRFDLDAV